MLSHLRFHRRGASNPVSPVPDHHQQQQQQQQPLSPLSSHDPASPLDARPSSSGSSALPPILPPIACVTSTDAELQLEPRHDVDSPLHADPKTPQALPSPFAAESGFIGGAALQNYRRDVETQHHHHTRRSESLEQPWQDDRPQRHRPPPSLVPADAGPPRPCAAKAMPSFSTPIDLQNSPTLVGLARRPPPGPRPQSDAPLAPSASATADAQRGKKGLPFLKNPMSTLLMRRKNNQNVPHVRPLPLFPRRDEPVYDPRIKGTRVHDFSAPRRKPAALGHAAHSAHSASQLDLATDNRSLPAENTVAAGHASNPPRQPSSASDSARSEPPVDGAAQQRPPQSPSSSSHKTNEPSMEQPRAPVDDKPAPPVPPKDPPLASSRPPASTSPPLPGQDGQDEAPKPASSMRTARSRNVSLSEVSALPRHMKSTSSRFSFDMIGAAKQEKLLEERHRQRELEKRATSAQHGRDSRFDDFDDDAFDYDAMMDDDGLEERIPGVNADLDEAEAEADQDEAEADADQDEAEADADQDEAEADADQDEAEADADQDEAEADADQDEAEADADQDEAEADADQDEADELDPDNDQENFAGFVFQRSNPASLLASPRSGAMAMTPRDADGKPIGFAMTRDTPSTASFPLSPAVPSPPLGQTPLPGPAAGLGIRDTAVAPDALRAVAEDELYLDDGKVSLANELPGSLRAVAEGGLYRDDGKVSLANELPGSLRAVAEDGLYRDDGKMSLANELPGSLRAVAEDGLYRDDGKMSLANELPGSLRAVAEYGLYRDDGKMSLANELPGSLRAVAEDWLYRDDGKMSLANELPGSLRAVAEDGLYRDDGKMSLANELPGSLRAVAEDELYFDDGKIGLENEFAEDLAASPEWSAEPFDESIFDNNDTDQFGRPVPGAFAQAQSQRRIEKRETWAKRESDLTWRLSAQSAVSRSTTAHTSLSVDALAEREAPADAPTDGQAGAAASESAAAATDHDRPRQDAVATYQADLAAAAHEAAASGKFERSAWPCPDDEAASDDDGGEVFRLDTHHDDDDDDDDDDGQDFVDMDSFEMDDDGIIAEANASALANDLDGWYGQEFGFYSAPAGGGHHQHALPNSSMSCSSEYEYANGGFFGPKGMGGLDRTTSGRMVSREPNLTPITERSEYSNRNSVMSTALQPASSSTPILQSPGLAQLAMMADRGDEQMTLSALLRLRSRAWGGSQASLPSSRDEGSPRSDRGEVVSPPWGPMAVAAAAAAATTTATTSGGYARRNSAISIASRDSEPASGPGSPTLTMGHAAVACASPCPGAAAPVSEASVPRPAAKGHHRHKSSADSVSYLQEEEEGGERRWVMERRRTGESGEVEILEREVVEGGRI